MFKSPVNSSLFCRFARACTQTQSYIICLHTCSPQHRISFIAILLAANQYPVRSRTRAQNQRICQSNKSYRLKALLFRICRLPHENYSFPNQNISTHYLVAAYERCETFSHSLNGNGHKITFVICQGETCMQFIARPIPPRHPKWLNVNMHSTISKYNVEMGLNIMHGRYGERAICVYG